jgi:3-methyladenine DNA glycosylase AlkD
MVGIERRFPVLLILMDKLIYRWHCRVNNTRRTSWLEYCFSRKSCHALIRREERFAKTAVGWALRDISKYDQPFVRQFMDRDLRYFSMESLRNALKYFDGKERSSYVERLMRVRRV